MLSDRPYMRDARGQTTFPALAWLIGALAFGFVVENVFLRWFSPEIGTAFFRHVTLSAHEATNGVLWPLLTHAFIHDPDSLAHLVLMLLAVFVFGRAIVDQLGPKRLLIVFGSAVITGGLAWLTVNWGRQVQLYGASAGVSAFLVLFACLQPRQSITFFLVDIGLRAHHLAVGLAAINVAGLFLVELPGRESWFGMAHSAHLGGMLAGWLCFRVFQFPRRDTDLPTKSEMEPPSWLRKAQKGDVVAPIYKVDVTPVNDIRAEIDRILDKINSDGFHSLTAEEKQRLDRAKDHLSRR